MDKRFEDEYCDAVPPYDMPYLTPIAFLWRRFSSNPQADNAQRFHRAMKQQ
jgi:hypothetical protein